MWKEEKNEWKGVSEILNFKKRNKLKILTRGGNKYEESFSFILLSVIVM